ncbi:DNA-binding response OmpR family regulator [Caldicellulosiruptor bescii]|uniref:Two component transcriptional regulator, winged helix family n=2 Tax=Caldicellulosiruptor bescii TaxID=31899 RepID=B9MKI7_CALBD|nr:response regulator transcription factor [Caldicellulosiruptor bescii]ACM60845.1 two component transcriptional regulator, winged helix family [Caldicellulosiruptor bescii DSM 6725]PBC89339.1 DNA-binding response OmpR family regulator [Caldicellulosiruptor bescii]PBC91176.1 DNA-binding response OmpR family regulator [Caldicellulosiruptor bescii]PBD03410.1 DNA-binding response OmpR family regulator [Caldicellulosiruptor bescii]PBD06975.1 DNA-binding response OmpR family regulator [Caldicellulo
MSAYTVYIVDDEKDILELVSEYLTQKGYSVKTFENGESFLKEFEKSEPDIVILDIMLPDIDGYEICKRIRKNSEVPIIMLSAKGEELDKVLGLELGSDDYIPKPFSLSELEARIKKILRRINKSPIKQDNVIETFGIKVDFNQRNVFYNGTHIELSPKEFETFALLLKESTKVLKRSYILERIWGDPALYDERMVDDVVKRLRKKILQYNLPVEIKTMWGLGYKLEEKKDEYKG